MQAASTGADDGFGLWLDPAVADTQSIRALGRTGGWGDDRRTDRDQRPTRSAVGGQDAALAIAATALAVAPAGARCRAPHPTFNGSLLDRRARPRGCAARGRWPQRTGGIFFRRTATGCSENRYTGDAGVGSPDSAIGTPPRSRCGAQPDQPRPSEPWSGRGPGSRFVALTSPACGRCSPVAVHSRGLYRGRQAIDGRRHRRALRSGGFRSASARSGRRPRIAKRDMANRMPVGSGDAGRTGTPDQREGRDHRQRGPAGWMKWNPSAITTATRVAHSIAR